MSNMSRLEMVLEEINKITDGEEFITAEQFEAIQELPYTYAENNGESGTGKGTWYTIYLLDDNANPTDTEVCGLVVRK